MNISNFIRIITVSAIILCNTMRCIAQNDTQLASETPRLVLILLVDNMNNEQLNLLSERFCSDGLKRILYQGTRIDGAYYDAGGNYVGKNLATLYTGAPASTHGIVGRSWLDAKSGKRISAIYGDAYNIRGEIDTAATPKNGLLLCSTIGNEIRKMYNSTAKIYSVGFDPEMLMWTSGTNIPEPTIWFDTKTGHMETLNVSSDTTQRWIDDFNSKGIADNYSGKIWAPRYDILTYHEWRYFPESTGNRTFYYPMSMPATADNKFRLVAGSPYGNSLLRDFAVSLLLNENLGRDDIPDVLTLQFNATPSCGQKKQPLDAETEDLLLSIDENIASLLRVVDHYIGMQNTLVILTSASGNYDIAHTKSEQWQSRGAVSLHRVTALLNLYLMALHGQGKWVSGFSGNDIYLNRQFADEKKIVWDSLLVETAQFLTEFQGVANSLIGKQLPTLYTSIPVVDVMRANYHPKRSGDIIIYLEPGWAMEQTDGSQIAQQWGYEYVPLAFYGWKIPRNMLYERHNMADVAPTICTYLRIGMPNGCSGKPIQLIGSQKDTKQ